MNNFFKKLRAKNVFSLVAVDLSYGITEYVLISWIFRVDFDYRFLALAIFFAFLPDIDFIPFIFFRKKFGMLSHQFIHYPLILLPLGFPIAFISGGWYLVALYLAGVTGHFINDTTDNLGGIKWLWPFSSHYFAFRSGKIIRAEKQREEFYSIMKKGMADRNIIEELFKRTRVENRDLKHKPVISYLLAIILLLLFLLK